MCHYTGWHGSLRETKAVSIVFDARKNADHSKRVAEANGSQPLPKSGPPPKDGSAVNGAEAQRSPVVRSLLQAERSESASAELLAARQVLQGGAIEPAVLLVRSEPVYPAIAKQSRITGSVELHFRISPQGKAYDV